MNGGIISVSGRLCPQMRNFVDGQRAVTMIPASGSSLKTCPHGGIGRRGRLKRLLSLAGAGVAER